MKASFSIYLIINGERVWMNRFTSKNSLSFSNNLCSTAWKSATDTASCKLVFSDRNKAELADVISKLVEAQQSFPPKEVGFEAFDEDETEKVFQGILDLGKFSIESSKLPESISISAKSYIDKLEKKPKTNFVLYPSTVKEVVERCIAEAGLDFEVDWRCSAGSKLMEVPFVVTDDDDDTWRNKIDTLLMEIGGFTLSFDHKDGKFYVSKVNDASKTFSDVPVKYHVQTKLKSTTTKFAKDGVVVSYGNIKSSANQLIYRHDISIDNEGALNPKGDIIEPGVYYPFDSDITKTYEEYDESQLDYGTLIGNTRKANDHIKLFYVDASSTKVEITASDMKGKGIRDWYSNSTFISPGGGFTYPGGGEFYPRKAWLSFKNKLDESVNITKFFIWGDTYYSDAEYKVIMPIDCEDPEEYSSEYISNTDTAKELANFLMNQKRFGSDISTWTERWEDHSLGDKVRIQHKSGNVINAVIVRKDAAVYGTELWAKITAVSLDGWSYEQPSLVQGSTQSPSILDEYENAKKNGFVGTREEWESRNDLYYLWSSSETKLLPKKRSYWKLGHKWMLFKGLPVGDFGMQDWEKSWEKLMEDRTETYNYLWAKVGENGEPFRLQGVSPMDFSVLATPPSYTVNPRRKDQFKITVKLTRLNGMKGASSLVFHGGPYNGIVIDSSLNEDEWEILVLQNTTTALEFKLKASIGGVEKVIGLSGTMIQNSSKYMGAVDTLPTTDTEGNKLLEGDWCVLKSDNLMYVYKAGAWTSVTDSQVNSFGELEKMSTALVDMIAIGSTKSTTATVLGIFKLLCADNGFIKFLKTWALYCGAGDENSGFYCRIADHDPVTGNALSKPVFIVKYNGQTVFQIDPSSGNVFMGKPNSSLTGAESGFMYDASNNRIVTKDNKLIINEDGSITANSGSFSGNINAESGLFGGNLNSATGIFNGSFITPSLESRPPALSTPTATLTLPSDASGQFAVLYDNIDKTYQCTLSTDSAIKYITMYKSTMGSTSYYEFYLYDSNMQKKYYNSRMTYKPLIGSAEVKYETTIPAGVLTIGTYGDVLVFKNIPYSSEGLEVGQIYQNTSHQLFIKTE